MHNLHSSNTEILLKPSSSPSDQPSPFTPMGLTPEPDLTQSLNFATQRLTPNLDLSGKKSIFDHPQSVKHKSGLLPTISATKLYKHSQVAPTDRVLGANPSSSRYPSNPRNVGFDNKKNSNYKLDLESKYSHILKSANELNKFTPAMQKSPIESASVIRHPNPKQAFDFLIPVLRGSNKNPDYSQRANNFPVAKSILKRAKIMERRLSEDLTPKRAFAAKNAQDFKQGQHIGQPSARRGEKTDEDFSEDDYSAESGNDSSEGTKKKPDGSKSQKSKNKNG
jgi:hypothetical protein